MTIDTIAAKLPIALLPLLVALGGCGVNGETIERCQCHADRLGEKVEGITFAGCRISSGIKIRTTTECPSREAAE